MDNRSKAHKALADGIYEVLSENLRENLRMSKTDEGGKIIYFITDKKIKEVKRDSAIASVSVVEDPKLYYYRIELNPSNSKAKNIPLSFAPIILSCIRADMIIDSVKKMFENPVRNF